MKQATVRLELDRRSLSKKDSRYPVKLVVYCSNKWKRYKTEFRFTDKEWNTVQDRFRFCITFKNQLL